MEYTKKDAKDWAKEKFRGLENGLLPSFTPDLSDIDEKGIRWDVQTSIRHGFFATLIGPDCGTTIEELKRMIEIVVDEARGKIMVGLWAMFDSFEVTIDMLKFCEDAGVDNALLALPHNFIPKTEDEIYLRYKEMIESTNLAINLYPTHKYNFGRFHPSTFNPQICNKLADIDNVVGMKIGVIEPPGYTFDCFRLFGDKILVSNPLESMLPLLVSEFGQQWGAGFKYEMYQTPEDQRYVKCFNLMVDGEWDDAMEIYYSFAPIRGVLAAMMQGIFWGTYAYTHWKYQQWLTGGNGGLTRLPDFKMYEHEKIGFRSALKAIGISPREPDEEFYVGRVNYTG